MNQPIRQAQGEKGFSQIILLGIVAVLILAGASEFLVLREKKMPSFEKTVRKVENAKPKPSSKPKTQLELKPKSTPLTSNKSSLPSPNAQYIIANPLDLRQIEKISKFRSCAGHDFSGHNFLRQIELDRSMKHYVRPLPAFYNDEAALFAPFDGTVYEEGTRAKFVPGQDRGDGLSLLSPKEPNAVFEFGHIYPVAPFKHGDPVKAGQLLGYAATKDCSPQCESGRGGNDFDLVVRAIKQPYPARYHKFGDTFDSVFNHMTPEVLAEYEKFGLTKETMLFSKEFRDAHPCLFDTVAYKPSERTGPQPEIQTSPDNWVLLKRQ